VPFDQTCDGREGGAVSLSSLHNFYLAGTGCCDVAPGSSTRELVTTASPALVDGPNHYTIEVVENNIKFWTNGALVFDYTDDTVPYAPGAYPITYGGFEFVWVWELLGWVDNVVVTDMRRMGSQERAAENVR
jgi:hypothetical protein